jgi:uncharacterized protein YjbI with pentapeptide repeats
MANDEHVAVLKRGVDAWHAWRRTNPNISPELSGADLRGWDLRTVDLSRASLIDTDLGTALLSDAVFTGAICSSNTNLSGTRLVRAKLGGVNLSEASPAGNAGPDQNGAAAA